MSEEVLLELTKSHLETGLRGIPVGYCPTSRVDPEKGLFYGDRSVGEIADWEPERVIYLLYTGEDGSEEAVRNFKQELAERATIPQEVVDHIYKLPRVGHPMALFSAALLVAGMHFCQEDYREDCLNLIAKIPAITAAVINHHAGWGTTPPSRPDLGYVENFSHMLQVPKADKTSLNSVLKLFNILHFDHGGGNLSTFVGKAVASGLEDLYGSIAAAMCALAGPRHGRANQECLRFTQSMLDELGVQASPDEVEKAIRKRLEKGELIYGFGHAVLRVEDPRATVLYAHADTHYSNDPLVKLSFLIRERGSKVLQENPRISDPYVNVDAISGILLAAAGFPYPDYYTVLFGLSRVVGIAIQIVYERVEARSGKGTPIVRPKYIFKPRRS